jgi:hypothetical protein
MDSLWDRDFRIDFSPTILSMGEASKMRPIYLDMVEDAIIFYDKKRILQGKPREA